MEYLTVYPSNPNAVHRDTGHPKQMDIVPAQQGPVKEALDSDILVTKWESYYEKGTYYTGRYHIYKILKIQYSEDNLLTYECEEICNFKPIRKGRG